MKILVTGAAGFIGFHLVQRLAERGDEVVGLDSLNDYYDQRMKFGRLAVTGIEQSAIEPHKMVQSARWPKYRFVQIALEEREALERLFAEEQFEVVVNLAAQAGVRYSIENPHAYAQSNVVGFLNVLECCRHNRVRHLVYASSSSVYGRNAKVPFSEEDRTDSPVSLYAATKKANELMAHTYASLYSIPMTGLRFFTVYGPWGRPDMAPMLFADAISEGRPIRVFNGGDLARDFTYIDDITEGVVRVVAGVPPTGEVPCKVYNIGCSTPVRLMDFISTMERAFGREAEKVMLPMQAGDVYQTYADTSLLERDYGYRPTTTLEEGLKRFVEWYGTENPLRR
jgi:UDP-glucuronate 4-epimerase